MVAAGQVHYVHGDSAHPQRLTEQGKPTVILLVTDHKCPYANIVVRKDLHQAGLTSIEKLGTMAPPGGKKWKAGVTAIGSGTWLYGNFILRSYAAGPGKTLNDLVEWIGVGGLKSGMGALKTAKIDLNMALPETILESEAQGFAKLLFDVRDDKQWLSVFKGPISAMASYTLKSTTQNLKDETQAYVTAVYKAVRWIKGASPGEIAQAIEKFQDTMGLSKESIVKAIEWYKPVWSYDLVFSKANYANVLTVAKGIKAEKTFPYEEIVDLSFLRKAAGRA